MLFLNSSLHTSSCLLSFFFFAFFQLFDNFTIAAKSKQKNILALSWKNRAKVSSVSPCGDSWDFHKVVLLFVIIHPLQLFPIPNPEKKGRKKTPKQRQHQCPPVNRLCLQTYCEWFSNRAHTLLARRTLKHSYESAKHVIINMLLKPGETVATNQLLGFLFRGSSVGLTDSVRYRFLFLSSSHIKGQESQGRPCQPSAMYFWTSFSQECRTDD